MSDAEQALRDGEGCRAKLKPGRFSTTSNTKQMPFEPMDRLYQRSYFFDNGIYFRCLECGNCCTGSPGIIYVEQDDINAIARYLKLDENDFVSNYLYPCRQSYSIREHADGRCFFYENGCRIYPVRPKQCRTFPFWLNNLRSEENWLHASQQCPGIGQGCFFSKDRILEIVRDTF